MSRKKAFILSRLYFWGSLLGFGGCIYLLFSGAGYMYFQWFEDAFAAIFFGSFLVGIICGIFHIVYRKRSLEYAQAEESEESTAQ